VGHFKKGKMLFRENRAKKKIIKAEIEKGEVLNLIYLLRVPCFFLLFLDESLSSAKPKMTVGFFLLPFDFATEKEVK
jgi:hypothetical protein